MRRLATERRPGGSSNKKKQKKEGQHWKPKTTIVFVSKQLPGEKNINNRFGIVSHVFVSERRAKNKCKFTTAAQMAILLQTYCTEKRLKNNGNDWQITFGIIEKLHLGAYFNWVEIELLPHIMTLDWRHWIETTLDRDDWCSDSSLVAKAVLS